MRQFIYIFSLPLALVPLLPAAAFLDSPKPLRVGRVDVLYGNPEQGAENLTASDFLSGSVVRKNGKDVNVPVPCKKGKPCTQVEFQDVVPIKIPTLSVEGKRWEYGPTHLVSGGFGPLAAVNGGLEPTGRKVVNLGIDSEDEFKVVIISVDESTGTVRLQAYFRACLYAPFSKKWLTCTPYFIPSPIFWKVKETEIMPIDINANFKPPKLSQSVKSQIKNSIKTTLKNSLKNAAINTGVQAIGGFAGSGGSGSGSGGSGGGGSSGGSCGTSYGHQAHAEASQSDLVSVGNEQLHKDAAIAFDKMQSAARNSGIELDVVSGFRSVAAQQKLWDAQVAEQGSPTAAAAISAPPGYSEHHTGYALDVGADGVANLSAGFENTPAYAWLSKNAGSFGFEQSFTRSSKIGADNEPWHWRFIGTAAAKREFDSSGCASGGGSGGGSSSGSFSGVFNGQTVYPVNAPQTSAFGPRARPCEACSANHMGIDLGVGDGTTVGSAASGRVVFAGWLSGYGNTIFIDHGSGYMTQYSHLQEFSVSVGQTVNIGQRIALSGHSGVGTGAHLHFGALAGTSGGNIHTGYYIDPHTFLGK